MPKEQISSGSLKQAKFKLQTQKHSNHFSGVAEMVGHGIRPLTAT